MSKVREARIEMMLTLEEAARRLQISAGYLSQIENGLRQISSARADAISKLYGKPKEDIFLASRYAIREVIGESSIA